MVLIKWIKRLKSVGHNKERVTGSKRTKFRHTRTRIKMGKGSNDEFK